MKKIILVLVIGMVFVSGCAEVKKTEIDPGVMEFPPLTLCKETGGIWKGVNSKDYPVDPEKGVYHPTTNPEINYKCFCPTGIEWDMEKGCK